MLWSWCSFVWYFYFCIILFLLPEATHNLELKSVHYNYLTKGIILKYNTIHLTQSFSIIYEITLTITYMKRMASKLKIVFELKHK